MDGRPENASPALPGGAAPPKGGADVIDEILAKGRGRQKRLELVLGIVILAAGISWRFAMAGLGAVSFGAIGVGAVLIARGLFGQGRGDAPTNAALRSLDPDRERGAPPPKRP